MWDKIVVNLCKEGLAVTSESSVFFGFLMKATMPDLLNLISKKLDFSFVIFFDWITNLMFSSPLLNWHFLDLILHSFLLKTFIGPLIFRGFPSFAGDF